MRISDWSSDVCSSDLCRLLNCPGYPVQASAGRGSGFCSSSAMLRLAGASGTLLEPVRKRLVERSEEHTSELQSLMRISYAVFCLKIKNITVFNIYVMNTVI